MTVKSTYYDDASDMNQKADSKDSMMHMEMSNY